MVRRELPVNGPIAVRQVRADVPVSWPALNADRNGFQNYFQQLLLESPGLKGRVLDIGCGGNLPTALQGLSGHCGTIDGIDPDPAIATHPLLSRRWNSPIESSELPKGYYDLAYAYNVLEHIAEPKAFFSTVYSVLKDNGVFWALTPNGCHPFPILSRSIELLGLKSAARRRIGQDESGAMRVNDYPAYYRSNTSRAVLAAINGLGFQSATFFHYPCVQWDTYFPSKLRCLPRVWDLAFATRFTNLMQILIIKLDKGGGGNRQMPRFDGNCNIHE
jgi:SAM-dependent methyltransferase